LYYFDTWDILNIILNTTEDYYMKKFVLCLITVLLVVTSVFAAEFKAGVKVDAAGKSDFNQATAQSKNANAIYFSVRPYYTDGHFDVALKLEAGYNFNNDGWYYFLKSYDDLKKAESLAEYSGFSVVTLAYISNYIDRLLFTTGGLQVGFVRDEQLDVTTLATGKFTKTPNEVLIATSPDAQEIVTPSTCQELSAIVSLDFGEHSIYAFAERFDQLFKGGLAETFGAEIIVPSIFIKDMHYRTSAIADLNLNPSDSSTILNISPEIGFELDTTFGEHKFNLTCALESVIYSKLKESDKKWQQLQDFAAELKANLTLGKFDLTTDVYLVRDFEDNNDVQITREFFRNVKFKTSSSATALGGSIGTTYHFGKGHELSFSTGIVLDTANGFLPFEFGTDESVLKDDLGNLTNLGTLDFARVGVKFGQDVWFRADAEVDYLWSLVTAFSALLPESSSPISPSDVFKLSISAGADLKDIDFEVKVGTGAPATGSSNLFDLYGSFKCTVDIHN